MYRPLFLIAGLSFLAAACGHRSSPQTLFQLNCSIGFLESYRDIEQKAQSARGYLGFRLTEEQIMERASGLSHGCSAFFKTFQTTDCWSNESRQPRLYRSKDLMSVCRAASDLVKAIQQEPD